jgi:hypothetical protein
MNEDVCERLLAEKQRRGSTKDICLMLPLHPLICLTTWLSDHIHAIPMGERQVKPPDTRFTVEDFLIQ